MPRDDRPPEGAPPSRGATYHEVITDLPLPTEAQTARFARFVAGAHSWYKHLPSLPPGGRFLFFLDPGAGRDLMRTPGGEVAYVDRTDESDRFHYTWMPTAEYRERFGCWQYHCDRSPGILCGSAKHGWRDLRSPARVLAPSGAWVPLPGAVVREGTCWVTALVHDLARPEPAAFENRHPGLRERFEDWARDHAADPAVARYRELLALHARVERGEVGAERLVEWVEVERELQRERIRATLLAVRAVIAAAR